MPLHRLFVGNIPAGTSEQELKQEFASYGPVKAIDLKTKPNPLNDSVDTFAFINIEFDDRTLRQCINEFRQEQYKGAYLNVSKAKESFLDRLKREREETETAKQSSDVLNPYKKSAQEVKPAFIDEPLPELPTIQKEVESSSSESSSESEAEIPEPATKPFVSRGKPKVDGGDQLVRKWNQETFIEHGKLKIVPITGEVKEVIDRSKNRKQPERELDDKARLADEKRKHGLSKIKSAYEQQKLAIQVSLAGAQSAKKKKIVFDDDDDDDDQTAKEAKLSLFGDEDIEDDFKGNFTVRKQLSENTEKGQRLFEMQTQFHGDSRFKLDERFLADDGTAVGRKKRKAFEQEKVTLDKGVSKSNNQERKKQLEILSKVTGREIWDRTKSKNDSEFGSKSMQRFDPSKQEHVLETTSKKEKKSLTEDEIIEAKRAERVKEEFQVSEDKFYKVSGDITQVLGSNSAGFSLLSMFGSSAPKSDDEKESYEQGLEEKPVFSDARFKYESSASEDEEDQSEQQVVEQQDSPQVVPQEDETKKKKKKAGYFSKQGVWKENFFFLPNDARFEEGRKFFVECASSGAGTNTHGKGEHVRDIRKIFKKRRMRETKNVNQMRAKRGLKLMKSKRK